MNQYEAPTLMFFMFSAPSAEELKKKFTALVKTKATHFNFTKK